MNTTSQKGFTFTGWHMAGVMVLFFGTIITVNVFMAYSAVRTWSGLVVPNTYVASQQFNGKVAEARALASTGVSGRLTITATGIRYQIMDAESAAVPADAMVLNFKRPVGEHEDFSVDLVRQGEGLFAASQQVPSGHWIVEASAIRDGARILHHAERVTIEGASR